MANDSESNRMPKAAQPHGDLTSSAEGTENPASKGIPGEIQNKVLYEIAQVSPPPIPAAGFDTASQDERDTEELWDKLKRNPAAGGTFTSLTGSLGDAVSKRVEKINGKEAVCKDDDDIVNLRQNLKQLRLAEKDRINGPYLTEAMRERDFSFLAVGTRETHRPDGFRNESSAGIEFQRLADAKRELQNIPKVEGYIPGSMLDPYTQEVLSTLIFENLRPYFPIEPIEQAWTEAKPWTDARKQIAVDKMKIAAVGQQEDMRLNSTYSKSDLERLHKRYMVAAIFAKIDETERTVEGPFKGYGAPKRRYVLDQFILNYWEKQLKIETEPWGPKTRDAIAMKYGVTKNEASSMYDGVMDAYDRVHGTKKGKKHT